MSKEFDCFINTDLSEYIGEWICIVDDKIAFHGADIKEGYKQVKEAYPDKIISIARVPGEMNCIY